MRLPAPFAILWLLGTVASLCAAPVASRAPDRDGYGDPLPDHAVARLGTVRMRHCDTVNSVAFSPDGKLLASAGDDRVVILWDVATGKEVRSLPHPNPVRAVLFTPDGQTLISASNHIDDTRVHLWGVKSGKELRYLPMPKPNSLAHMVLSKDGKTLFTSTVIGPIVAWDIGTGRELWRAREEKDWCKCLAVAPDGKRLATGSDGGHVSLWDAKSGEFLQKLPPTQEEEHFRDILSLAFSPDGRFLALTDERGHLSLWDITASKYTNKAKVSSWIVAPLAFSPDSKQLACGLNQRVCLFDPATGKETARLEGHHRWIRTVAFSADGRYLASAGQDRTIRIWNAATLKPLHSFADNPGGRCVVSFQRDGNRIVTTNSTSGEGHDNSGWTTTKDTCERRIWIGKAGEAFRNAQPEPAIGGPGRLSPDGKALATPEKEGLFRLIDAKSGKWFGTVGKTGKRFKAEAAVFSRDGQVVALVSDELEGIAEHGWERLDRLRLWNVATGQLAATAVEGNEQIRLTDVQFSARGRLLVAEDGPWAGTSSVRLWYLHKGNSLRRFDLPKPLEESYPLPSDDESLLVTRVVEEVGDDEAGISKQTIRIRELLSGKVLLRLPDQIWVSCYVLSPDNRFLAIGDEQGLIRLVEVPSGKEVRRLRGHRGRIASLEFSADGALLISGSDDTTALVWDVRQFCPAEVAVSAERLSETLWTDLASTDVIRAVRAEQTLRANPTKAVALLKGRLRPMTQPDAAAAEKLIGDLDSDDFTMRERAANDLRNLERTAIPLLTKAREATRSAEARRRLDQLLLDAGEPRNAPEQLRNLRAIHCLGVLNTEAARQFLRELAKGAPDARLTQKACEELDWLESER